MKKLTVVLSLMFFFGCGLLPADRRNYVWTYQYMTMPPGETELEFYQTTKLKETDEWEYRIEVEHGITDRWDFSVYQIFKQTEMESLKWDAVQFRTRYRFGEEGRYFMDPLLYLEYNRKLDHTEPNKFEAKFILAKTIDRFNISVNPLYEYFFAPGTEHEAGLDMGISYEFDPRFTLGLESTSRIEFKSGRDEKKSYIGPTVSFASGRWWYTLGGAVGLNDESGDGKIRFIMGVGF